MKVIFLGTGCDYATPEREPSSILIKGPPNILLDCSPAILKQLAMVYIDPLDIDAVFISHRHAGHSLGLPFLIWGNIVLGRRRSLEIFMPKDNFLVKLHHLCLEGFYPGEARQRMMFESHIRTLNPTKLKKINIRDLLPVPREQARDDIFLYSAPLSHWEKEESDSPILGCSIVFPRLDIKIAYAPDTQPCNSTVSLSKNSTLLIHDASFEDEAVNWARQSKHSTAKEAGMVAKKSRAKILALIHLHATRYRRYDIKEAMLRQAKQVFDGPVIFPSDLEVLNLSAFSYSRPSHTMKKKS